MHNLKRSSTVSCPPWNRSKGKSSTRCSQPRTSVMSCLMNSPSLHHIDPLCCPHPPVHPSAPPPPAPSVRLDHPTLAPPELCPYARQALRKVLLNEGDKLLPDLAAQVPGFPGIGCRG